MKKKQVIKRWTVSFFDKNCLVQNSFDSTEGQEFNNYMAYIRLHGSEPSVVEEILESKSWMNQ